MRGASTAAATEPKGNVMATGDEGSTPTLAEWGDKIAVGGLVLAGLLVSVCGPILRRRNETLRDELDQAHEHIEGLTGELGVADGDAASMRDQREEAKNKLAELDADEDQAADGRPMSPTELDAYLANGQAAAAGQGAELP